jgi:hypothetical protein
MSGSLYHAPGSPAFSYSLKRSGLARPGKNFPGERTPVWLPRVVFSVFELNILMTFITFLFARGYKNVTGKQKIKRRVFR